MTPVRSLALAAALTIMPLAQAGAAQVVSCEGFDRVTGLATETLSIATDKVTVNIFLADSGEPACCAVKPLLVVFHEEDGTFVGPACYRIAPGEDEENARYGFAGVELKAVQWEQRVGLDIGIPVKTSYDEATVFEYINVTVSEDDGEVVIAGAPTP